MLAQERKCLQYCDVFEGESASVTVFVVVLVVRERGSKNQSQEEKLSKDRKDHKKGARRPAFMVVRGHDIRHVYLHVRFGVCVVV